VLAVSWAPVEVDGAGLLEHCATIGATNAAAMATHGQRLWPLATPCRLLVADVRLTFPISMFCVIGSEHILGRMAALEYKKSSLLRHLHSWHRPPG
jgi:hypothetical protein